ncbi:MAG: hypothetical protein AAGB00_02670 [Planctomycetota bacterium]
MVAPRKVRYTVITLDAAPGADPHVVKFDGDNAPAQTPPASPPRRRPSDMLPWADPYIAGLVRKLQREVREEARPAATPARMQNPAPAPAEYPVADLEWPWDEGLGECEPLEREPATLEPVTAEPAVNGAPGVDESRRPVGLLV